MALSPALDIILRTPPTGLRALTLTNVITDATRRANAEGDGLAEPGGFGVFPAATNRCINGNATTNTAGVTDNSSTTSRVTTGTVKFGTTAFEVVSGNAAANEGPSQSVSGGAASTQYTVSAWAWLVSGAATVRATLQDDVSGKQGGTGVVLTATPQRVRVTATTGALAVTFNSFIETTVQQAGTWRVGGWQVETGNVATPFVTTDGGTATRSAGGIEINPTGLLTPTQGWIAYRLKMGWSVASEALPGGDPPFLLMWRTDASNTLQVDYVAATDDWRLLRNGSGTSAQADTAALTFATGDEVTIIVAWDAAQLHISFNNSAYVSAAQSVIPALPTTMYLASWANTRQVSSLNRWIIMGKGSKPTTADVAAINAYAAPPPTLSQIAALSSATKPTLLIPAKTADAVLLPAYFGGV